MRVQNIFIALTTSIFAVSSSPAWSVAAATQSTQNVTRQAPATLITQRLYPTAREIRTCPSRVSPQRGGISLEQARTYFICRYEKFTGTLGKVGSNFAFVDDLKMQMAAARTPTGADLALGYQEEIDLKQPVYPIKVSYTSSDCGSYHPDYPNPRTDGKCLVRDEVKSVGVCFRSNFGEWHCKTRPISSSPMRWAAPSWAN
jgi:hypothetical protein